MGMVQRSMHIGAKARVIFMNNTSTVSGGGAVDMLDME